VRRAQSLIESMMTLGSGSRPLRGLGRNDAQPGHNDEMSIRRIPSPTR
jgi:hypothetical protein